MFVSYYIGLNTDQGRDSRQCATAASLSEYARRLRVHIDLGFEEIVVGLAFSDQAIRLTDLVPVAQVLEDSIVAAVKRQQESLGNPVSCGQCCSPVCCQYLIGLSTVEAAFTAELLMRQDDALGHELRKRCQKRSRQLDRFADNFLQAHPGITSRPTKLVSQLEQWYGRLAEDCVLLKNNQCMIYPDRPLACRHWLIAGRPADCSALGVNPEAAVAMPVSLTDVLIETAFQCLGTCEIVILPTLIDWYENHSKELHQLYRSEDLILTFLQCLQESAKQHACGRATVQVEGI
jgi:Fe-S-cluster containining protein